MRRAGFVGRHARNCGNGARRPMRKVFDPSPGATGLSICLIKLLVPSRCRGASGANASILFVSVGVELKSYMHLATAIGAAGTATTSPMRRDKPCRVTAIS
jgi:hypothetical protein